MENFNNVKNKGQDIDFKTMCVFILASQRLNATQRPMRITILSPCEA